MEQNRIKEAFVRRRIVNVSLGCRVFVVAATLIFHWCDFLFDEFSKLMCHMLPVTCLFLTVFIKFTIQNRYQRAGGQVAPGYAALGISALFILNLAELAVIVLKGINNSLIDEDSFFMMIALFEAALSIFAGIYLLELFGNKTNK